MINGSSIGVRENHVIACNQCTRTSLTNLPFNDPPPHLLTIMTTYQLSAYEQARLDKIQRNEERLKSLGLLEAKKRVRKAATARQSKQNKPSKKRTTTTRSNKKREPTRASRRLKHKPVQYEPLMDDDESLRLVRKKFKEVKKNTKRTTTSSSFKCEIPAGALSSPLNEKEKRVIEEKMEGDFLGKFEVRVPS